MGLLAICIAALLSENSCTSIETETPNSVNKPVNHVISDTAAAMLLYSASAELRLMVCCFLDFYEIKEVPRFTTKPVTDLLVLGQDAQSESQYAVSWSTAPFLKRIPSPGVPLMYLITRMAASICYCLGCCMN